MHFAYFHKIFVKQEKQQYFSSYIQENPGFVVTWPALCHHSQEKSQLGLEFLASNSQQTCLPFCSLQNWGLLTNMWEKCCVIYFFSLACPNLPVGRETKGWQDCLKPSSKARQADEKTFSRVPTEDSLSGIGLEPQKECWQHRWLIRSSFATTWPKNPGWVSMFSPEIRPPLSQAPRDTWGSSAHSWNHDNKVTFLLLDGTSHRQSRPPDLISRITWETLKEQTIKMSNSIRS